MLGNLKPIICSTPSQSTSTVGSGLPLGALPRWCLDAEGRGNGTTIDPDYWESYKQKAAMPKIERPRGRVAAAEEKLPPGHYWGDERDPMDSGPPSDFNNLMNREIARELEKSRHEEEAAQSNDDSTDDVTPETELHQGDQQEQEQEQEQSTVNKGVAPNKP